MKAVQNLPVGLVEEGETTDDDGFMNRNTPKTRKYPLEHMCICRGECNVTAEIPVDNYLRSGRKTGVTYLFIAAASEGFVAVLLRRLRRRQFLDPGAAASFACPAVSLQKHTCCCGHSLCSQ